MAYLSPAFRYNLAELYEKKFNYEFTVVFKRKKIYRGHGIRGDFVFSNILSELSVN